MFWPLILLAIKHIWGFFSPNSKKAQDLTNVTCDINGNCCPISEEDKKSSIEAVTLNENSTTAPFLTSDMNWEGIIGQEKKTIVRFTAKWCKPCKAIEPLFNELAVANRSTINFLSVDVDEFDTIAAENGAISIPLFVCFQNGKFVDKLSGKDDEKLKKFVSSCSNI